MPIEEPEQGKSRCTADLRGRPSASRISCAALSDASFHHCRWTQVARHFSLVIHDNPHKCSYRISPAPFPCCAHHRLTARQSLARPLKRATSPQPPFRDTAANMMQQLKFVIVGAGPVGSLAALYAARRGYTVEVYELRSGTTEMIRIGQWYWPCPTANQAQIFETPGPPL